MNGIGVIAWKVTYIYTLLLFSVYCTIDMTTSEFSYIADHLSETDCRRLVASLQFLDYDLPINLSDAMKLVPTNVPCIELLLIWNREDSKTGGKGRSHVDVSHRLRQLRKRKLADWLEKAKFSQLALDVDTTLNSYPFKANEIIKPLANEHSKNEEILVSAEHWTIYDTVLWTGIIAGVSFAFCQVASYRICANKRRENDDELEDLLFRDNLDSDDEYASENIYYNSVEHFDED